MSILHLLVTFVLCVLKSQRQLVVENIALRQQVAMLRQSVKRPRPSVADRLFWIIYSRYVNGWRNLLHSLHPDTVLGFKNFLCAQSTLAGIELIRMIKKGKCRCQANMSKTLAEIFYGLAG